MICPICKTENRPHAKFCDECGHRFLEESDIPPLFPVDRSDETEVPEPSATPEQEPINELDIPEVFGNGTAAPDASDVELTPEDIPEIEHPVHAEAQEDGEAAEQGDEVVPDASEEEDPAAPEVHPDNDFSGFVFADPAKNEPASADNLNAFETQAIPLNALWGAGNTQAMPRITPESLESNMSVSAPANKKELRERNRAMKKREREARKALKNADRVSRGHNVILIVILALAAVAVLAAGVGYYLELWGGKTIPNTQGMTQADAVYTLQNEGFNVRVSSVKSDDTEGLVLLTDPASGSRVAEGSEVVVHVSQSRTIPQIVGTSYELALAALAEAGYTNVAEPEYVKTNEKPDGTVLEVSPSADTKAKSSTKVTLKVSTPYRVPDVSGMDQDNAVYTLREAGYYVYISEVETTALTEGTVYTTQPAANTVLDKDEYVTIYVATQRSSKLVAATKSYLQSAGSITLAGTTYTIQSVDSVTYTSNGVVNFTITGQPTTTFLGETISLSARSVSGSITFDDNNQIVSVS